MKEERNKCQIWINELKKLETGKLVDKIEESFETGINCRPEMEKLWEEELWNGRFAFCRNDDQKKSQFEIWIESNFVEKERSENLKKLAKQCALIDMVFKFIIIF